MKKLKYFIIGLMTFILCSCYTVVETVKIPTDEVEYTYTESQVVIDLDLYYGFYSYRYFWYDSWYPIYIIYYPYWYTPYWYTPYHSYWYPYHVYPYWYPYHRYSYYSPHNYSYNNGRINYKIRNSKGRNYNTENREKPINRVYDSPRDGTKVKVDYRKSPVKKNTTIDRKPPVKRNTTIDRKPPVKRNTTIDRKPPVKQKEINKTSRTKTTRKKDKK